MDMDRVLAMTPLFWRLIYADDHQEDEPLAQASIRLSHRGAVMLQACYYEPDAHGNDLRRAHFQVSLIDAEDARIYRPVFYRIRSLSAGVDDARTEGVVVGRAREEDNEVGGTLWLTTDGDSFVDCPEWAVDKVAVEGLVGG